MPQLESWPANYRIIEIDPADGRLGDSLIRTGYRGYLGVTRSERLRRAIVEKFPRLAGVVTADRTPEVVRQNNASLLILSGRSALRLWMYRDVRHAQFVAWKVSLHPISLLATLGWLIRFLVGQYKRPIQLNRLGGDCPSGYLVSRVARPKRGKHVQRHFIPHHLGLKGLVTKFHDERVDYLVLRWFEELPEREPTGDIDLLVADEHVERVLEILGSGPAVRPCDLYTCTGLPESSYQRVSYYPPEVARRMLKNARLHRGFCRVPSQVDYFHNLAYHAVYHKGRKSNLPGAENYRTARRSSRDFKTLLSNMAAALGIDVEISLAGLHAHLQQRQWAPPPDWLARLATSALHDRWLAELASQGQPPTMDRGFTVFVIRQSAVDAGVHERIISMIEGQGFIPLARKTLTKEEVRYSAPRTRDGNWGPGPRDHIGGDPAMILATYDPQPLPPTRAQLKRWPHLKNARTLAKEQIREQINREIAPRHPINGVHSSDYGGEAHHFLHTFAPELVSIVQEKIVALRGQPEQRRIAA